MGLNAYPGEKTREVTLNTLKTEFISGVQEFFGPISFVGKGIRNIFRREKIEKEPANKPVSGAR